MESHPSKPAIDPERIQPEAAKVVRRLASRGFAAYLVGGCVRDLLLDRPPKDFDVATSARPRQVKRLFRNSRIIGRRFRLAHIHFGHRIIEVATFRAPPRQDGDDPYITRDNVWGTEKEDAFRRDFTINGLFYDINKGRVIDHVGGLDDLEHRRLRVIGDPDVRLPEDPVRILRAARFAGRLDFELSNELLEAARRHAGDLEKAAPPRVLEELFRLLNSRGAARAFRLLEELAALPVLLPEVSPLPEWFFEALRRLEEERESVHDTAPQWLLLALLLAPMILPRLVDAEEDAQDFEGIVHDLMRPVALRLTVARRDSTRARQVLAAQMRLLEAPRGRSARRYVRRDFFHDALHLRRLLGPPRPVDPDPLPQWEAWAHDAPPPTGESEPGQKRRRRRRRRGGRRRRGKRKQSGDE
jgi:poly(A) polymerase